MKTKHLRANSIGEISCGGGSIPQRALSRFRGSLIAIHRRLCNCFVKAVVCSFLALGFWMGFSGKALATQTHLGAAKLVRTTRFAPASTVSIQTSIKGQEAPEVDAFFPKLGGDQSAAHVAADHLPRTSGNAIVTAAPELSFDGLTVANEFSLSGEFGTPPDQALAVGDGYVLEGINSVVAIYDSGSGAELAAASLHSIFGISPFARISDPRAYYDANGGHWFITEVLIDAANLQTRVLIAVSQTSDPMGSYNVYSVNSTSPGVTGCPCLGDQPLIGADANGFYIDTNEFNFVQFFNGNPAFVATEIFALDKTALETGAATVNEQDFILPPTGSRLFYSLEPATVPPGGAFDVGHGGTEYFMGSLDDYSVLTDQITVFALTNTGSLASSPDLALQHVILPSEVYGPEGVNSPGLPAAKQPLVPVSQYQQALPLAYQLRHGTCVPCNEFLGVTGLVNAHEEFLQTNDDRMTQVVFAGGHLFSALQTALETPNGYATTGAAWFAVTPSFDQDTLTATMTNQGYVSANGEEVLFPSIGMNAAGQGAMSFTLVGPDYTPSAAYAPLDASNGAGEVKILAPGAGLVDSIDGYVKGTGVDRFGDYSAAVSDESGNIWLATEYIPSLPPVVILGTPIYNYGTRVSEVHP